MSRFQRASLVAFLAVVGVLLLLALGVIVLARIAGFLGSGL